MATAEQGLRMLTLYALSLVTVSFFKWALFAGLVEKYYHIVSNLFLVLLLSFSICWIIWCTHNRIRVTIPLISLANSQECYQIWISGKN